MRTIPLTKSQVALVDDADYDWLNQWKWFALQSGSSKLLYAARKIRVAKDKQGTERMHRTILGLQPSDKMQVDHIDGNRLNNQRSNLRICTIMQNMQSQKKRKIGTSKYKGVCWHRDARKWRSYITINKKRINLGCFDSEIGAAKAYDIAATEHHREFALTNKMLGLFRTALAETESGEKDDGS